MAVAGLSKLSSWIGTGVAVVGFGAGAYVFLEVQVLESYPFHGGVFGTQSFFLGVTYTQSLELFGVVALFGLFMRAYFKSA